MMTFKEEQALKATARTETIHSNGQPAWVTGELPAQYAELENRIAALRAEAHKFEEIAAVLWQTGLPLTLAVRALFSALKFEPEPIGGSENPDIRVQLDAGRRLIVQVIGGRDSIDRKSPLMSQILRALQEDAVTGDRVVVAANAFCDTPLASRRQESVTPDALRLIQGLGANLVTTSTLFGIWRYSLQDLAGAKKSVFNLHAQDGGIFR